MTQLPLAGIRILSLAEQYPGPYATSLLADLGADVILVERPGSGDPSRRHGGHFESLNRNKRSIALDLKSDTGRDAFLALVDTADVVMEGFRPGVMTRLGFDAAQLAQRKPALIFISISSFGQDGPLAAVAGHDLSVQGVAGLINVPLGQEAQAIMPWLPLADIASAMFAAISVLSALLTRSRSGQGSTVDVSMLDSLVSWMAPFIVPAINGMMPAPLPPKDPGYGLFGTADDRQITLSIAGEDHMWNALCVLLGLDDLAALTEAQRVERAAEVGPILRRAVASRPLAWLVQQLELRQIAFGPVLSLAEVADGAQVVHRGMIASVPGTNGAIRHVLQPLAIKGLQTPIRCNAPRLGEHTNELLRECRYDPAATIRLAAVATAAADGASAPA